MKRLFKWFAMSLVIVLLVVTALPSAAAEGINPQGTERVLVQFRPGQKAAVLNSVNGMGAKVHYEFDELNTVAMTVPAAALDGLRRNPNVVLVEPDAPRYLMGQTVPYGIDLVQARDIWDVNRDGVVDAGAPTGAGMKVCIIDSGLNTGHEDFAGVTVLGGYPSNWNTDGCGHGTHVAGTIAAANNNLGVVGVTPGAVSLYIVKVFGDDCGWTYASTLVDAANRCASAGAKIISMSLGGSTSSTTEKNGFANLYSQGILSIAAAGNDGTTAYSYPASYDSVVSVAAIDQNKVVADFSQKNSQVEVSAPGVAVLSTVPWLATSKVTVDGVAYNGHHVENAAYGSPTGALVNGGLCDSVGSWSGKVVLCQRGTISFYDKVHNVQLGGGAAAIIYNNVDGELLATLGDGYSSTIPALGLTKVDGEYLVANKLGLSAAVVDTVVKPGSGYEAWDGTSMATPHVSAVAALIWSGATSKTNAQVRDALKVTALDLGVAGKDNSYGYGLVQAKDALAYLGGGGGDTTPPVISGVSTSKLNKGKFTVRWTTNEASTTVVVVNGLGTFSNSTLVTSHSITIQGVKGAIYTYYVTSVDAAGNSSTAGPFTHQN
jgi:subtilisin family serine protease